MVTITGGRQLWQTELGERVAAAFIPSAAATTAAIRFGEADRMRRLQGDLDAVAGSWTMEREEDGYVQHRPP